MDVCYDLRNGISYYRTENGAFKSSNEPKAGKRTFYPFSCALAHEFFIQKSRNKMTKVFHECPLRFKK